MTGSGSRLVPDGVPDTSNHENHENTHYNHSLRGRTGRRGWPQFPVRPIYENQPRKSEDQNRKRPRTNQQRKINRQENTNRKSRYETSHTVHPPSRKWRGCAGRENRTATSTLLGSYCGGRVKVNSPPNNRFNGSPILRSLRYVKKAISCQNHLRNDPAPAAAPIDAARRSASPIQLPDQ